MIRLFRPAKFADPAMAAVTNDIERNLNDLRLDEYPADALPDAAKLRGRQIIVTPAYFTAVSDGVVWRRDGTPI